MTTIQEVPTIRGAIANILHTFTGGLIRENFTMRRAIRQGLQEIASLVRESNGLQAAFWRTNEANLAEFRDLKSRVYRLEYAEKERKRREADEAARKLTKGSPLPPLPAVLMREDYTDFDEEVTSVHVAGVP